MKFITLTLTPALILGASLSQAAGYVNDFDRMSVGSSESDNTVELANYQPKRSLPINFIPSVDLFGLGSSEDDGTVELLADGRACPTTSVQKGIC